MILKEIFLFKSSFKFTTKLRRCRQLSYCRPLYVQHHPTLAFPPHGYQPLYIHSTIFYLSASSPHGIFQKTMNIQVLVINYKMAVGGYLFAIFVVDIVFQFAWIKIKNINKRSTSLLEYIQLFRNCLIIFQNGCFQAVYLFLENSFSFFKEFIIILIVFVFPCCVCS